METLLTVMKPLRQHMRSVEFFIFMKRIFELKRKEYN